MQEAEIMREWTQALLDHDATEAFNVDEDSKVEYKE